MLNVRREIRYDNFFPVHADFFYNRLMALPPPDIVVMNTDNFDNRKLVMGRLGVGVDYCA
ncbi:MAG TPA: hypothetical protein VIO11_06645 [Candidatus Methanoperedens sp.]